MPGTELFSSGREHEPLAARMRPRTLDEYIGQDHIVGKGRLLRRAIAADQLTSVIFYGPPGSGKTTLARVIANHTKSNFITLNAVLTGVADIRKAIADAEDQRRLYTRKTILFVDEVHRWNKSQQDALLPWVENGTIILIGATTENPFFEVNKALVSRSRVFQLRPLGREDLLKAAGQALQDTERGYGHWKVEFEKGALEHLVDTANGDARSLLNALELAVETTPERWEPDAQPPVPSYGSTIYISREAAEESIQKKVVLYDRDGDYHYDIISAFIKSLRGRDPDAACYWLARMVKAGEDPDFIFRRMLISACEDTGLADPHAISVVESCATAFDRVGMPEGRYFLAHAALYLATAPKSNSSMAFFDALASVEKEDTDVPNHLKDASRDAEGFGHGAGYLYPHAYRDHWVAQQYLPDALVGRVFYTPSTQGYEADIREDVLSRRELQIAALLEGQAGSGAAGTTYNEGADKHPGTGSIFTIENPISEWWMNEHFRNSTAKKEENLTFSPNDRHKDAALDRADRSWRARLDTNRAETLLGIRNAMLEAAGLVRHHRSLVWNADDALLLFDIMRKTPEGITCGACRSAAGVELLTQYASTLGSLDKPMLALIEAGGSAFEDGRFRRTVSSFGEIPFDRLFFRDCCASVQDIQAAAAAFSDAFAGSKKMGRDFSFSEEETLAKGTPPLLAPGAQIIIFQRIPASGQHISRLLAELPAGMLPEGTAPLLDKMAQAEAAFFGDRGNPLFAWDGKDMQRIFGEAGFTVTLNDCTFAEKRRITDAEIARWFNAASSAYGAKLAQALGEDAVRNVAQLLSDAAKKTLFTWHSSSVLLRLSRT